MSPRRSPSLLRRPRPCRPCSSNFPQQGDLLAALFGGFPDPGLADEVELSGLELPKELPWSLPSRILEQRPDIRQAEENLHAASAQIGVAVANRLPNVPLTADAGSMALAASRIFASGDGFWMLAGSVTAPVFQGGSLLHRERAARAAYSQAEEQYRGAVVAAFQNVVDTLSALEHDADALRAAAAAKEASEATLILTRRQSQAGYAGSLTFLAAELAYRQSLVNLAQAQGSRFADTAALFQALGGGWWNRADLASR